MKKEKYDIFSVLGRTQAKRSPETILTSFIGEKINSYIEPQRRGTPKGEPIGMTRKKYIAALFMLTNLPQKEIASSIGISHGVLRKWNSENVFKDLIIWHCGEFVEIVMKHIEDKIDEAEDKTRRILKHKGTSFKPLQPKLSALNNSFLYGECILLRIKDKIFSIIRGLPSLKTRHDILRALFIHMVAVELFFDVDGSYLKIREQINNVIALGMIARLKNIHKNYINDKAKGEADYILSSLEKYLSKNT